MSTPPPTYGKYRLIRKLGEGGMGEVFHARLEGPAGASKNVALKLIHERLLDREDALSLFRREARTAMALSHRNIVQTFDADEEAGRFYIVMELMDAGSLDQLLKGRSLSPELSVFVAREIASALAYAHEPRGMGESFLIHRDVSFGNILLSSQGDVKLSDFGVARALGPVEHSVVAGVRGKFSYMAPEQLRGEETPRSDVFALGAVLFRLVTGAPLRRDVSLDAVAHPVDDVEGRLSRAPLAAASLKTIVASMLAFDPRDRPTASELRKALTSELARFDAVGDPHARLQAEIGGERRDLDASKLEGAIKQLALEVPTHTAEVSASLRSDSWRGGAETLATEEPPTAVASETEVSERGGGKRALAMIGASVALLLLAGGAWFLGAFWFGDERPAPGDASSKPRDAGAHAPDSSPDGDGSESADLGLPRARDAATTLRMDGGTKALEKRRSATPRRKRKRYGKLDINASPWARVVVDGRFVGNTPIQGLRLRAGRHRIRLERGKVSQGASIRIKGGERVRRSFRLPPQ